MYFDPVLLPKLRKDFAFDAYVCSIYLKKNYGPFLWMGLSCVKATESLQRDCLFFTNWSLGDSGTHLLDFGRIKDHCALTTRPLHPLLHYSLTTRSMLHNIFSKGLKHI